MEKKQTNLRRVVYASANEAATRKPARFHLFSILNVMTQANGRFPFAQVETWFGFHRSILRLTR